MIISKTPFRVSLFGGSTDYEDFYSRNGSILIGFTMNQYNYIVFRPTPSILPHKTNISYSKTETIYNDERIEHNGVRGVFDFLNVKDGFEISYLSDLPARTGIGSSSSFIVGLLNCFYSHQGKSVSKKKLANDAIYIERKLLKEPGGIQDQIWAAYGGMNLIHIDKSGDFKVKPLPVSNEFIDEFFSRAILIYTGRQRKSYQIASSHDSKNANIVKSGIQTLADFGYQHFIDENIDGIAETLHQSWCLKRNISNLIASSEVNSMYNSLISNGMIGGKLLGSGGSGFIFGLTTDVNAKQKIVNDFKHHYIDIGLDRKGSEIIHG